MFEGKLQLEYLEEPLNGKWFRTLEPIRYTTVKGRVFNVPSATYTDFASVPRGFRWLISRVGVHGKAALLHDWLCEKKIVKRKEADKIFLEAMKETKVGWLKRRIMFMGVRAYSIFTFKK